VGLARRHGRELALAVVPRLTVKLCELGGGPPLGEIWGDTAIVLPDYLPGAASLVDCFTCQPRSITGETLSVAETLNVFPVALLTTQ
jgi:maltooligosyltrehalose synthase